MSLNSRLNIKKQNKKETSSKSGSSSNWNWSNRP